MVDPELYRTQERQDVIAIITAMMGGTDFHEAVGVVERDFHPCFFPELDWQELRVDQDYSQGPGTLRLIDDYVFVRTLPSNVFARRAGDAVDILAFEEWVQSYNVFFQEWMSLWPDRRVRDTHA